MATGIPRLSSATDGGRLLSSPAASLPWSEVLPYRSVKIDLLSAWYNGWRPPNYMDFSSLLNSYVILNNAIILFPDSIHRSHVWVEGRRAEWGVATSAPPTHPPR